MPTKNKLHLRSMPRPKAIEQFGWNKESALGFIWHQGIGLIAFLIDIAIIFALYDFADMRYPYAVAIGLLVATTFAYLVARNTIYANTEEPHGKALVYYFFISVVALLLTVGGTIFFTEIVGLPFYVGRIIMGLIISVGGYLVDCLVTFKLR